MTRLLPKTRLLDLCGPGHAFNARVPANAARWVFGNDVAADAATGSQLTVVGDMPVLCSAGAATTAGLRLLRDLGFVLEAEVVTYVDEADRQAKLAQLAARGLVVIDQHAQPEPGLRPGASWVEPALLSALNNKGNLSRWVPADFLPTRALHPASFLRQQAAAQGPFPQVVKAVTETSCGGGYGVRVCRDAAELAAAWDVFRSCDEIIVENYLAMRKNLCLNYAVYADGRINYLGATAQIIDDALRYQGNWLEPPAANDDARLIEAGYAIMRRAWQEGYRGFAGFDVAVGDDGTACIYDLNFRFNGSTVPLLLYPALAAATRLATAKFGSWSYRGRFDDMIGALRTLAERQQLLPIGTFDPAHAGAGRDAAPQMKALLFGMDRADVIAKEAALRAAGFE